MSKQSRYQESYRQNASKNHTAIGNLLRTSQIFSHYKLYQEYPVKVINPSFKSGRERFDWVILDLKVIIECHGQQHKMPVRFGGISQEEAEENFKWQKHRDHAKQQAAIAAGYTYVIIWYDEEVTEEILLDKIEAAQSFLRPVVDTVEKPQRDVKHQERLAKAREYRKARYKQMREWRKKHGNSRS